MKRIFSLLLISCSFAFLVHAKDLSKHVPMPVEMAMHADDLATLTDFELMQLTRECYRVLGQEAQESTVASWVHDCYTTMQQGVSIERTELVHACSALLTTIAGNRTCLDKLTQILQNSITILSKVICLNVTEITTPQVITDPGYYCLTADVVGTITISGQRIILDLNNHQISGTLNAVELTGTNIVIKNGIIRDASSVGITANVAENLTIEDITFIADRTGIVLTTVTCLTLQDCTFRNHLGCLRATNLFGANLSNLVSKHNNYPAAMLGVTILFYFVNAHNVNAEGIICYENALAGSAFGNFTSLVTLERSANIVFKDSNFNHNFDSGSGGYPFVIQGCKDVICIDCTINNNSTGFMYGLLVTQDSSSGIDSEDVTLINCSVNQNISTDELDAFYIDRANNVTLIDCQANENRGAATRTVGFVFDRATDIICKNCLSLTNSGPNSAGFLSTGNSLADSSVKVILEDCIANDMMSTSNAYGFQFVNTVTSCIIDCIAKKNVGDTTGQGIALTDCAGCVVQSNRVVANSSVGIQDTTGINNMFLQNKSQENGTLGANNYSGVPASLIITYDIGDQDFTTTNTRPFINLAVQP
ncbi:MAG: hypothetical protein AB7R69_01790 [Candidatus Babeliales bacterium]